MKQWLKERWWMIPPAAAGLAFIIGFAALIHAHESRNSEEEGEHHMEPVYEPPMDASRKEEKQKRSLWWLLPLSAVVLAVVANLFFVVNTFVPSGSMEPTIPINSLMLGDRTAYRRTAPQAGDVVLFHHPEFGDKLLVKRIVALPGQTFSMENGRVYVNGQLLEERYISEFSSDSYPETVVPEGCYIVLGDHRTSSDDSRFWNDPFVRRDNIVARALVVYFIVPRPL